MIDTIMKLGPVILKSLTQACIDPIIISIQPTIVAADIPKNKPKLQPTSETKRFQKF